MDAQVTDAVAIRVQLERLLSSSHIRNSKRSQALLKYVVEAFLNGSLEKVKERIIGFEVFGREADYDTNQDSVVRTTAADLRKRLAQYYLETGHEHELRVVLPQGSYIPEFRWVEHGPSSPVGHRRWLWIGMAGVAVACGAWLLTRLNQSAFDRFWKPLIEDRAEAVICIEQPLRIYSLTGPRQDELNEKIVGSGSTPELRESTSIKLSELSPAGERYFTHGDLVCAVRIGELLARTGKSFQLLGDRSTSYHDLRGRPAILLGQFNNKWTVGLTSGVRFYLDKNAVTRAYEVRDRQQNGKLIASVPRANRPEEYAIVSRVLDVSTEKMVVAVAGTTFRGTLAGGDFLTHPAYMEETFRGAPVNWWRRNVQVVLRTTMVTGTPGPPKAIATHFW